MKIDDLLNIGVGHTASTYGPDDPRSMTERWSKSDLAAAFGAMTRALFEAQGKPPPEWCRSNKYIPTKSEWSQPTDKLDPMSIGIPASMPKSLRIEQARAQGFEGDACPTCGNFTLTRNGTCLKCNLCGSTTGCS